MKLSNIAFAHPVLGASDTIRGNTALNWTVTQCEDDYECQLECIHVNDDLNKLVSLGKAIYVCEINCSATIFRDIIKSSSPIFSVNIPRKLVRGKVDCTVLLVASEEIPEYTNTETTELYAGFDSFYVEQGDVLGIFGEFSIETDIQYNKLKAVSSIMEVQPESGLDHVKVDLDGERITIFMPEDEYKIFSTEAISKETLYAPIFFASLVESALVQALYELESHSERIWAKTIKLRLDNEDIFKTIKNDSAHIHEVAQKLLGNPNEQLLHSLQIITDRLRNK